MQSKIFLEKQGPAAGAQGEEKHTQEEPKDETEKKIQVMGKETR